MKYIAIVRERGPAWDPSLPMRKQKGWKDHAEFMDALAAEGFVVLGGPWGEGERRFPLTPSPATSNATSSLRTGTLQRCTRQLTSRPT